MRSSVFTHWMDAMKSQIDSLHNNHTWDLVDPPAKARILPNKWVYSFVSGTKSDNIYKARLVARGDLQKEGIDYKETYAPVVKLVSLRVLLTWAKLHNLTVYHWDVVSAFLHGTIDVDVYMRQLDGFDDHSGKVCKLGKAIYGLCQAARLSYIRLDEIRGAIGYSRLSADWAIWIAPNGGFIACHVDDMAAAGSPAQLQQVKTAIQVHLQLKDLRDLKMYLNIRIYNTDSVFYLSQTDYIDKVLQEFNMSDAHTTATPMLEDDRK